MTHVNGTTHIADHSLVDNHRRHLVCYAYPEICWSLP